MITDREAFVALVDGKELRLGLMGISLYVTGDGMITGTAAAGT